MSSRPRHEIIQMLPGKQAVWIESAATLDEAKNRVRELVQMFPGDYFIFDRENACFVVPSNLFVRDSAKQENAKPSPSDSEYKAPDAGSRFAQRRSVPRFTFDAPVEMTDPITKSHAIGRVSEISQRGCFIEAQNLLGVDSVVQLRIHNNGNVFETWARVVHSRPEIGMGLYFLDVVPNQSRLLAGWLEGLKEH